MNEVTPHDGQEAAGTVTLIGLYAAIQARVVKKVGALLRPEQNVVLDPERMAVLLTLAHEAARFTPREEALTRSLITSAYTAGWNKPVRAKQALPTSTQASIDTLVADLQSRLRFNALASIPQASMNLFTRETLMATASVTDGGLSWRQAAAQARARLQDQGLRVFTDKAGRQWQLTTYTRMAVRTSAMNAYRDGALDRLDSLDIGLVRISVNGSSCAKCGPWEGRVLAINADMVDAPTLDEARSAGLFHPNCRHSFTGVVNE